MAHTFFHRFIQQAPGLLKSKLEEIRIIPGIKRRVPLAVKVALAGLLIPGAAPIAGRFAITAARRTAAFAAKRPLTTLTGIGILQASPTAARFVVARLRDPTGVGKAIGGLIEDPSKLQPGIGQTPFEKVKEVAKVAGVVGGVAALTAAVIAAAKKRRAEVPGLPGLPGAPGLMAPVISQPFGAAKKPEPEKPKELPAPAMPSINNRITFKPEINIRISKSRKFINQQLLIR